MYKMVEYQCGNCGNLFESLESTPILPVKQCELCMENAVLVLSAPMGHVRIFEVTRGGVDPTPPGCISTRKKDW